MSNGYLSDYINRKDIEQSGPDGKKCPVDPDHGRMGVHGSGNALLCGKVMQRTKDGPVYCQGHEILTR